VENIGINNIFNVRSLTTLSKERNTDGV